MMGLKNPLGSKITINSVASYSGHPAKIIGITENILIGSPYESSRPMFIRLETDWINEDEQFVAVRLPASSNLTTQLKRTEAVFKKLNPSYPFQFTFADDDFNSKFYSLNLIQKLVDVFAFLAIAIASLGLFGLAAFTVERRTKEFGVRRVLGATVSNLVVLISNDFTKLVLIAFIIASPIAWFGLQDFLEHYPYRISISWWILPLAGLAALSLTLLIVTSQAIRAASVSASESLKCE
jgi:ABC-type antimicrobial peptide transport system permease subunit